MLVGSFFLSPSVLRNIHVLYMIELYSFSLLSQDRTPKKTAKTSGTDQTGMEILTYPYGYGLLDYFSAGDVRCEIKNPSTFRKLFSNILLNFQDCPDVSVVCDFFFVLVCVTYVSLITNAREFVLDD